MKIALITGITGQTGSYLAELLLEKDYIVHGIKRRTSLINTDRIDHLYDKYAEAGRLVLHYGDLTDSSNIISIIQKVQPNEIYNLGAMSHVQVSFEEPEYSANVDGLGALRILEAIRILGLTDKTKYYQASTSEMFGLVQEIPQKETTPFYPRSPYAVAKLYAHWITINYRESYGIYACNGILFNMESPVRGETFVTRKITMGIAQIVLGKKQKIMLGNLNAQRDWGHAKDYARAIWLMLQQSKPDDYVISTGITTSIRDFAKKAFARANMEIEFTGEGIDEKAIVMSQKIVHPNTFDLIGQTVIEVDKKYFRPAEVDLLLGDASKSKQVLGWTPKYTLDQIIEEMVASDIELLSNKLPKH